MTRIVKEEAAPLQLIKRQRSHLMVIFSNPQNQQEEQFVYWNHDSFYKKLAGFEMVLSHRMLEKHEVDVTEGEYQRIPFQYLTLVELSIDGAQQAEKLAENINQWHLEEPSADTAVIWIYYPACEKVGRPSGAEHNMLTFAFANALPNKEAEFQEWYCTRHIRHALYVPQIVSGQCYARTGFQPISSPPVEYSMIAIYEQEGTQQEMIESFHRLPDEIFDFPTLDLVNFAEWVYRPVEVIASENKF